MHKLFFIWVCSLVLVPVLHAANSFQITNTVSQIVGSTSDIPGSGTVDNTAVWDTNQPDNTFPSLARFLINNGTDTLGLEVVPLNPTGALSSGTDSLMIARTSNSQGLTDMGTLSIYVRPSSNTEWGLDVAFRLYDETFTTTVSGVPILLTSLDIDFAQRYSTLNSDFSSAFLSTPSNITVSSPNPGYTTYSAIGDSTFSNPAHAVASLSNGLDNEFQIRLQHNGVALFMFEFRDPSSITGIPEPGTNLIIALGLASLIACKLRKNFAHK